MMVGTISPVLADPLKFSNRCSDENFWTQDSRTALWCSKSDLLPNSAIDGFFGSDSKISFIDFIHLSIISKLCKFVKSYTNIMIWKKLIS